MVHARTLEKYIEKSPEIAQEAGTSPEVARKVMTILQEKINNSRRKPREPAPPGSITLRFAARKYGITKSLVSYWCKKGYIKILKRTPNWLYLDENSIVDHLNRRNGNKN